jgi:hypothetical protein
VSPSSSKLRLSLAAFACNSSHKHCVFIMVLPYCHFRLPGNSSWVLS